MRVYLDMCSIQRPLDTRSHARIAVEAEAVLGILAFSESGQIEILGSDALELEAAKNPHPLRKRYAVEVLSRARVMVRVNQKIQERARALVDRGLKTFDALHLASAEAAEADFFCTCDDRFFKIAKVVVVPPTKVVTPLELIMEVGY